MIEYGYGSNRWMARIIISQADPTRVKKAVIEIMDWMDTLSHRDPISTMEIFDRLVQVSATGGYTRNFDPLDEMRRTISTIDDLLGGGLSPEDEQEISKFKDELDAFGTTGDDEEFDLKQWWRELGIPNEDEETEND